MESPLERPKRRRAATRKVSGDTIEVKQKKSASVSSSEGGRIMLSLRGHPSRRASSIADKPARKKSKDKRKVTDVPHFTTAFAPSSTDEAVTSGDEDEVEEYTFSPGDYAHEDEPENDDLDDVKSVISLSSEASTHENTQPEPRPWLKFGDEQRLQWELMYANVTTHAIHGDWQKTEEYQCHKDIEMIEYLKDFPLHEWVLPKEAAEQAYYRLLERTRWRTLGIRIYGRERIPEWIPGSTNNTRGQQQALNIPRDKQKAPVREPSRTSSTPQVPSQPLPVPQSPLGQGPHSSAHHSPASVAQQQPLPAHQQDAPPHSQAHQLQHASLPSQPYAHGQAVGPPLHHGPPAQRHFAAQAVPMHAVAVGMHPAMHPGMHPGMAPGLPPGMPPQMGRPMHHSQHVPYGMAPYPPQYMPAPAQRGTVKSKPPRTRTKQETPAPPTPPPPPPTPPYDLRQKPNEKKAPPVEDKRKPGRRPARRQAEAEEFPWTRQFDYKKEKENATWDDGVYDPEVLMAMEAIRSRNAPVIDELDSKVQEQQRMARNKKKDKEKVPGQPVAESSDAEGSKEKKKMQRGQRKGESGGDPYHSGSFAFVTLNDEQKAIDLGYKNAEELLEAGKEGKVAEDKQAEIKICWNPGKKGTTENLEQVEFSLKDTLVTRKQLGKANILTRRAAECVIDFCPDLLWRGMLLRICSEAGFGNKDVRDRFCYNGCYCDKATITKRISAALGQKQVQPKSKGYQPGEFEWYEANVKDFTKYIEFFGKRQGHRNMLKIQMTGDKKRKKLGLGGGEEVMSDDPPEEVAEGEAGPSKRAKAADGDVDMADADAAAPEAAAAAAAAADANGIEGEEGDETDGGEQGDDDAVSVQNSDILDELDD